MKKILAMLLAVGICFSFTACGKEENNRSRRKSNDNSDAQQNVNFNDIKELLQEYLENKINKITESNNIDTKKEIECPDFVGQKLEDIISYEEYSEDFNLNYKWECNAEYEYGTVYNQSVKAGERLKKEAEITLYVSMGQKTKKVPDVYGMTESEAVSTLKSAGFTCVMAEIADEETPAGRVVKTDPQRTEIVTESAEITVYLSSGKSTNNASVPDVVGYEENVAKSKLSDKGFVVEKEDIYITFDDKYYPIGYVTKQKPEGTTVKIYVCAGYEYEVEVDLPSDFKSEFYYLSLWSGGKRISESAKLNSSELSTYKFTKLPATTEKELDITVKISADQISYENLYNLRVDNQSGRTLLISKYDGYTKR